MLNLLLWLGYIIVNALYARTFGEYVGVLLGFESETFVATGATIVMSFLIEKFLTARKDERNRPRMETRS